MFRTTVHVSCKKPSILKICKNSKTLKNIQQTTNNSTPQTPNVPQKTTLTTSRPHNILLEIHFSVIPLTSWCSSSRFARDFFKRWCENISCSFFHATRPALLNLVLFSNKIMPKGTCCFTFGLNSFFFSYTSFTTTILIFFFVPCFKALAISNSIGMTFDVVLQRTKK